MAAGLLPPGACLLQRPVLAHRATLAIRTDPLVSRRLIANAPVGSKDFPVFAHRGKKETVMSASSACVQQIGRVVIGAVIASKLATSGYKKGSLNRSGSIAAFVVAVRQSSLCICARSQQCRTYP